MVSPLRVALVGYGLAGRFFHAPFIAACPDFAIASVVTRAADRRAAAEHDIRGVRLMDDVDELWNRAGEHDVAVVATPLATHAAVATAALEAGLHVVVEKPFTAHADDARSIVQVAEQHDRVLTVYQSRRWDGDFQTVAALIAAGSIGQVTRFESRFERWRPDPQSSTRRHGARPDEADGLLYDLGSHLVDQAIRLFGRPLSIYAEIAGRRPEARGDDDSFIALEHAGGVRSHLSVSAVAALPAARFRVLGSRGAYMKEGLDVQEEQLLAGLPPGDPAFGIEPEERWGRLFTDGRSRVHRTEPARLVDFYPMLADAIRNGAPPPVDPHDAVTVIEVLEAAVSSARTGTTQR